MNNSSINNSDRMRFFVALMSWCGILIPFQPTIAAESDRPIPIVDIALDANNSLRGMVMSADGKPQSNTNLELRSLDGRKFIASTKNGYFAFKNVTGGSYQLVTPHSEYMCRVWTSQAAPPAAITNLLVVSDARIARAQRPISQLFAVDPLWVSVAIAAAVVIPIAVHNSGGDRTSGS